MTESALYKKVKRYLDRRRQARDLDWFKVHGGAMQRAGVLDLMIWLGDGRCCMVELKATGKEAMPLQELQIGRLIHLKHNTLCSDNYDEIIEFIQECER